jgi:hypothetical protein
MPNDTKYTIDQLVQQSSTSSILINEYNHSNNLHSKEKQLPISSSSSISSPLQSPAGNINKKRHTISISSDDDIIELIPENDCQRIGKKRSTKQTIINPRKHDELIDQI